MQSNAIPAGRLIPASASCRFFIAIITALLFMGATPELRAQTDIKISGQVIDIETQSPIAGALISLSEKSISAVSDAAGRFYFSDLPSGEYTLSAERIGYRQQKPVEINLNGVTSGFVTIPLAISPVTYSGMTVVSRSQKLKVYRRPGLTEIEIPSGGIEDVEDIADAIPELEIINSADKKYIRIRGAGAEATNVSLDGVTINSTLDNRADLSSIPISSVHKVEIITSGPQRSGLAGTINFITNNINGKKSSAGAGRGSFGRELYSADLERTISENVGLGLNVSSEFYRGNFTFTDPRGDKQVRENDQSFSRMAYLSSQYLKNRSDIKIAGSYSARNSGVPGPALQYTPDAESESHESRMISNIRHNIGNNLAFLVDAGITIRRALFESPQTPTNFIPYRSEFTEGSREATFGLTRTGQFEFDARLSTRYESLDGKDMLRPQSSFGFHSRMVYSAAVTGTYKFADYIALIDSSSIGFGINTDFGDYGDFSAPSATLRVNLDLPLNPGFDAAYSRGRRLPNLTDLYWKEDVFATPNIDLKPERSANRQIGADIRGDFAGPIFIRTSYFSNSFRDLIIWRKWAGDKFKPLNLSEAHISGWEFTTALEPFSGPFSFRWTASFIKPLNKEIELSHHNKYLTFRPIGSQTLSLSLDAMNIRLRLTGRHIGKRYQTEENTKVLPAVDLADLIASYSFAVSKIGAKIETGIYNIGNIQYEILERQPETPREFRLKIKLEARG